MADELRVGNIGRMEETAWHALDMNQVLSDLQVRETGVTAHEAEERMSRFGPNQLAEARPTSFLAILWEQLNNFLVLPAARLDLFR
jgi:Ca2+-transporting ATPase